MNPFLEKDWIPIIVDVRLPAAESALKSWLEERGLTAADISKHDLAQEVSRLVRGGTGSTYFVRRSRLQQLIMNGRLKKRRGRGDRPPALPPKKFSTVRMVTDRFESQGAPAGTLAWIIQLDVDEIGGNRYQLEGSTGDTQSPLVAHDGDFEVLDSPVGQ